MNAAGMSAGPHVVLKFESFNKFQQTFAIFQHRTHTPVFLFPFRCNRNPFNFEYWMEGEGNDINTLDALNLRTWSEKRIKAERKTHEGRFTHSMPCPRRAAKGLECVFPILFT